MSVFSPVNLYVVCSEYSAGGDARIPAVFDLGFESALHVLTQIINVFLSHAEFDIHEDEASPVLAGVTLGR